MIAALSKPGTRCLTGRRAAPGLEDSMHGLRRTPSAKIFVCSVAFVAALTLFAQAAAAADLAPPMFSSSSFQIPWWTGFYIGGEAGYAWGKDTTTEFATATNTFTGFDPTYNIKSAVGGLYAGYNYQIGWAVLGIESDIEAADIRGGFDSLTAGGAGTTRIDWQGSFRARLGYATDKAMFYGTGGLAFANISHTYSSLMTGVAETSDGVRTGWTAGAGIEIALMTNVLARVEYRYTDYGPYRYNSVTAFPGFTVQQEPLLSSVRGGIAYKF